MTRPPWLMRCRCSHSWSAVFVSTGRRCGARPSAACSRPQTSPIISPSAACRYAAEDRMLERSRDFLLEHLRDFLVAKDVSGFLGCCALAVLTPDLAEVRSLAVRPEASGRGIGRQLVLACIVEARRLGLRRVFALTLVPDFFQRCGFVLTSLGRLPEKSASECPVC